MLTMVLAAVVAYQCESPPKLVCDFTDREAVAWAHWRDFDLHAKHEDRDDGFCESHDLWASWVGAKASDPSDGYLVTKQGVGLYARKACSILANGPEVFRCEESGVRSASICVVDGNWTVESDRLVVANIHMSAPARR